MWTSHVADRYGMLILQLLCILPDHPVHVHAKDVCQVGQEKKEKGQWRWVLPYEYPCECGKIIYGGMNIDRPKRSFKPVYVKEPMVGDNVGDIRDHYGLNCIELTCPTFRSGIAKQGQATKRMTFKSVKAVGNHGERLNVTCDSPSGTKFPIGKTSVACYTEDQMGNTRNCTFNVNVIDFDECTNKSHNCSPKATCTNTNGGYNCTCKQGYEGNGLSCKDIDECATNTDTCHANGTCSNTDGSYECTCKAGNEGDGFTCEDIDECATTTHTCHANGTCSNTDGSYECICKTGYSGDGFHCADIDECTTSNHACHANGTCFNTDGSYECTCKAGYSGDGLSCEDIDECAISIHTCHVNGSCSNTVGSYDCACNIGYSGDGVTCRDIDECATDDHGCHPTSGVCINTDGSYYCTCKAGDNAGNWILHNNYCYFFKITMQTTFQEARTKCRELEAELVSIHCQDEQDFIASNAQRGSFPTPDKWWDIGYWIGFNDQDAEGDFVWTDGTMGNYTNWHPSQPNHLDNQDCVSMAWILETNATAWNDLSCIRKLACICKSQTTKL